MVFWYHIIILFILFAGATDAFHLPSLGHHQHSNNFLTTHAQKQCTRFLLSKTDNDTELADLDTDLAQEIEAALSLAQEALTTDEAEEEEGEEVYPDEEEIADIANMLLETPPVVPKPPQLPLPVPPKEEPSEAVISLGLNEGIITDDEGDIKQQPLPPQSPPPEEAISFAETLQKKAAEEMEKLKISMFGVKEELEKTEANIEKEEEAAVLIKKEIEDSLQKREDLVKRIEKEFAAEKELLVAQMEVASAELKSVMEESAQNITNAKSKATEGEKELISRVDSLKTAIDEVTSEIIGINMDKEKIEQSKQTIFGKVIQEGKNKLVQFKKSFDVDISYANQINADLLRRVEEAESKVRGAYDQIKQMRTERVSLQEQIANVEKNALDEISSLERGLKLDEERYATTLQKERERLDGVIEVAYQAYAIRVCKKITKRQAVEADYEEQVRQVNMKISAAKQKHQARVSEYLDKLEEKHKKERIAIYQEKIEAVSAIRNEMNDELAVEYAKIEDIHGTMQAKIDAVNEQTNQVKVEFEKAMNEKRKLAKEEEDEILSQIEDVRVDMTDKIKTQRRLYEEKKEAYLQEINGKISDSEVELRQGWRELAGIKKSYNAVSAKRDGMIDDVAQTQALIDSYESDRKSFRKSVSLTTKVAKEKIRLKTRRLLKRDNK